MAGDTNTARTTYPMEFSNAEIERLKTQHEWLKLAMHRIVHCPFDFTNQKAEVLDSATADGTWLLDLRRALPSEVQMVGFDIASELFPEPSLLPDNLQLVEASLLDTLPADWTERFDLVNQRLVASQFLERDLEKATRALAECVKPGGWIQFLEGDVATVIADSRAQSYRYVHEILQRFLKDANCLPKVAGHLKSLGFENIELKEWDIPIGKSHENLEIGMRGRKAIMNIVDFHKKAYGAAHLGLQDKVYDEVVRNIPKDMDEMFTGLKFITVVGQKVSTGTQT
ncbi:hypothetical protein BDZ85DRAFT_46687 [Elsinoe ampelina]|uniref:S-adenosyl-L-methionine-dependent methyltransferase n=1 Tax=Elsinoe ampelina TaxID=302913 RepID=A0A6A6G0L1_9PEZI|nr:hypothetical protein BDZ85DRAFT_46687 [Elsinoe ampelina]